MTQHISYADGRIQLSQKPVGGPGNISASGVGSFARGKSLLDGHIRATRDGSIAFGYSIAGEINASGAASLACGFVGSNSRIGTYDTGASVLGFATASSTIINTGRGSLIAGYVKGGGSINIADGADGSFIAGFVNGGSLNANGVGSFACGVAAAGLLEASGAGSTVFGHASNDGNIRTTSSADGGFVFGRAGGEGALIESDGDGAVAGGFCQEGGEIRSLSNGSFAFGNAGEASFIRSNGVGSLVGGYADSQCEISSSGHGSLSLGFPVGGSKIRTFGTGGAIAGGYADSKCHINAGGGGSTSWGYANLRSTIAASGDGSHAGGFAVLDSSIEALKESSFAHGYAGGYSRIISNGYASISMGMAGNNGIINTLGAGSFAGGYADDGSVVSSGNASITFGSNISSNGPYSAVFGRHGEFIHRNSFGFAGGNISSNGDAQFQDNLIKGQTTTATLTEILMDGSTRLTIPQDTTWAFRITTVARRTDVDGESAGFTHDGVIYNDAGTVAIEGTVSSGTLANPSSWAIIVDENNTNDALRIRVRGEGAKTIKWVSHVHLVQVKG